MFSFAQKRLSLLLVCVFFGLTGDLLFAAPKDSSLHRFLYAATPGIRNYLEYGGHGLLVFDIDAGHKFVKRIPSAGLDAAGKPLNVRGICANAKTQRLYVSTIKTLLCFDLTSDVLLWEKAYEGGCDRMALSPDGRTMYLPSDEQGHWHVIDALDGKVLGKIVLNSAAHNTVYGADGRYVYLAGLRSHWLAVADTRTHLVTRQIGPFSNNIRPFTVNAAQTRCFVNVNDLLGFEIGDLKKGQMLQRVEVEGFAKGPTKRHGCPSHGIALTRDEKEIWLSDAHNSRLHIFDVRTASPRKIDTIVLRDQPGWITFSIDGQYAYPSTGDVIDVKTRKIVAGLKDETGMDVQSEKMLEVDFKGNLPVRAGNQFGLGATK
jgi:DNA-binding beta-propeller fold protein YncE